VTELRVSEADIDSFSGVINSPSSLPSPPIAICWQEKIDETNLLSTFR